MATRTRPTHPFHGARKMKPTQRHRAAIWENMLGTVYAANDAGEVKYFDFDWDAARAYAEVDAEGADPRVARCPNAHGGVDRPRKGQLVLYVRRQS